MVAQRADRWTLPLWAWGADFIPALVAYGEVSEDQTRWSYSCPQGEASVGDDLLATPLDTDNYFHTFPRLLTFASPGLYHLALDH